MAASRVMEVILLLFSSWMLRCSTTHIKGVATNKLSYYNPSKDFTCFDGTKTLAFSNVNDDYCDCPDGSDEPGTSACHNGQFTCKNDGFKEIIQPSNRVNDGVCDCCDGSDEYDSDIACSNTCDEEGRAERERLAREREAAEQGYLVKLEYMKEGKQKKIEREAKFEELKVVLEEQKARVDELKASKERAETPENEAKEVHKKAWEEVRDAKKKERQKQTAIEAFTKLDLDQNLILSTHEMMANPYFDKDMTEQEVKDFLNGAEEVDAEKLIEIWGTLEPKYKPNGRDDTGVKPPLPPPGDTPTPTESSTDKKITDPGVDDGEDDEDDDQDSDAGGHHTDEQPAEEQPVEEHHPEDQKQEEQEEPSASATIAGDDKDKMPEYDEETKRLIAVSDQIRREHDAAEKAMKDTEKEHTEIDRIQKLDLGPEEEFQALLGHCYDYTEREYTYKLCPFDKAIQMPKSGGSETSLGTWQNWEINPSYGTKYRQMKYADGLGCWNGPNRSATVHLSCGTINELAAVSEPNRCEYHMEFRTPALCIHPTSHDEL